MEQEELFKLVGDTHKPKVLYYRCGQGLIFKDEWRYFSFQLVATKIQKRKQAQKRSVRGRQKRGKRGPRDD